MSTTVGWRLVVDTEHDAKARKVAAIATPRIGETGGVDVEIISIDRYWKLPGTSEVVIRSSTTGADPAHVTFDVLRNAGSLGNAWITSGPHLRDGGRWELEAVASTGFGIAGLIWASVAVLHNET